MTLIDFPKPKEAWTPPKTLEDWPWEHDLAKPHGVIGDNGIREPERFIPGSCRYCGVPESHLHEDNCPRLKQPAKTLADLAKPHGVIGDNGIREPAFPESEVNPNGTIKPWPRETNDLARYKDAQPSLAPKFLERLEELSRANVEMARKKNADYANEGDPFANFTLCESMGISSTEGGIMVRMTDKMQRIANLLQRAPQTDESILDACSDLANYALILRVYLESK